MSNVYLTQGDDFAEPIPTQQRDNLGFVKYSVSDFIIDDDDEEVDFDNMYPNVKNEVKKEELDVENNISNDITSEANTHICETVEDTNTQPLEKSVEQTIPSESKNEEASQELFSDTQEREAFLLGGFSNDEDLEQRLQETIHGVEVRDQPDNEHLDAQNVDNGTESHVDVVMSQNETNDILNIEMPMITDDDINDVFEEMEQRIPPEEQPSTPCNTDPESIGPEKPFTAPISTQSSPFKKTNDKMEDVVEGNHSEEPSTTSASPKKPYYKPPPDVEQAGRHFHIVTLQRGIEYKDENRIFGMDEECVCEMDGVTTMRITSKCWGNRIDPYEQEILVQLDNNGIKIIRSRCSCPITTDCKHCCASIMTWLECRRENKEIPRSESLAIRLRDTTRDLFKMKQDMENLQQDHQTLKEQVERLVDILAKKEIETKRTESATLGKRKNRDDPTEADGDIDNDASQEEEPQRKSRKVVHFDEQPPETLVYSQYDSQAASNTSQMLDY
jgi:hypothetical protein